MILTLLVGAIVVRPGTPVPTIAAGLRLARAGDTVFVEAGEYREAGLVIDKPLALLGRGHPSVQGAGAVTLFRVTADGVTISGLTLSGVAASNVAEPSAIRLDSVRACRITGNQIRDAFFGIYGSAVADCLIADNQISGLDTREQTSGNGIHLWSSRQVTVSNNTLRGQRDGIYLEFVVGSHIEGNQSVGNRRYGLHFMFSDSCRYTRNTFAENGAGVAVMYSKHVDMEANRFERNRGQAAYGLLLKDISDGRLLRNQFAANTIALYLEGTNRVVAEANTFTSNGWAVRLLANSQDSEFRRNVFRGNAFDVATNSRNTKGRFLENWWDRYRGFDLDGDGLGDTPFRPVRLFSLIVEQNEPSLVLLRSAFVDLLDAAERLLPILTPETLTDPRPRIRAVPR